MNENFLASGTTISCFFVLSKIYCGGKQPKKEVCL